MINIKRTIYENINYRMNKLMKLADNDPVIFKKLIYLIILDDLFDWADYQDDQQAIQKKLQKARQEFLYSNPDIKPEYDRSEKCDYVNVNTPQTNSTWLNVWDQDPIYLDEEIVPVCFAINTHYTPKVVELPYYKEGHIAIYLDDDNETIVENPNIELTTEEQMDYYLDKYSRVWYKDPTDCEWKLKTQELTPADKESIVNSVKEEIGDVTVSFTGEADDKAVFNLATTGNNELDIMDENEINDLFEED